MPNTLAYRVEKTSHGVQVQAWDAAKNSTTTLTADAVIMATPRFVAERLYPTNIDLGAFHYSPWMVANVTLNRLPQIKGVSLSWDNMIYDSKMLGYVNATNQSLRRMPLKTVLTYYWPLSHSAPGDARKEMIARPYEEWRDIVLAELLRVHPDLKGQVASLDVWLWGHGMIRPTPGFVWGNTRQDALKQHAPIFYAHSDMSGVSIFEEANYHGVQAARALLAHVLHAAKVAA